MIRQLRRFGGNILFLCFLIIFSACATTGEQFPISLSYQKGAPAAAQPVPSQKVVVFPLEDTRKDPKLIGRRTHLFGAVDTFETTMPAGKRVAELLVEALRLKGWQARPAGPNERPEDITGDRVVTGKIQALWAEAESHLGYTQLIARVAFDLKIRNPATGEQESFKINDENSPRVVFFHPELIEETLNDMVSTGLNRLSLSR